MSDSTLPARTFFTRIALPAFSWGLPFHSLVVAMLFGGIGLSAGTVRMMAAWKELTVLALLLLVVLRAALGRGPKVAISWVDLAVGSLLVIAAGFLIAGKVLLRIDLPPGTELYGIRDIAFFMLLYFVGRATPDVADSPDTLRRLYIIAVLVSAIAIVEAIMVTPDMLVLLGVASYFQDFLNVSAFTAGNDYGLPMSYWTRIGNVDMQRAGSIFLSSQAFAVPFLILMPAATAYVFGALKRRGFLVMLDYAIIWAGLLLSITRMTVVVCALQLFLVILMLRKPEWAVSSLFLATVVLVASFFIVPGLAGFAWDTLTWQTSSSTSHTKDWSKGVEALFNRPWGAGLGTTDQSAVRFGLEPLTADNGYLKYAVELGVGGLIAHLAIYTGLLMASLKVARYGKSPNRRLLGIVVLVTTVGVMLNATTGVVFNALTLSYLFAWFGGVVVTVSQQDAIPRIFATRTMRLEPA